MGRYPNTLKFMSSFHVYPGRVKQKKFPLRVFIARKWNARGQAMVSAAALRN